MKLQDLKETKPIEVGGNVTVRQAATSLDYDNIIVHGFFTCSGSDIKTLNGSPIRVIKSFDCSDTDITSLKGCPREVGGSFYCNKTKIRSLKNVHEYIDRIGSYMYLSHTITSNILGLLKIHDLVGLRMYMQDENQDLLRATTILNRYFGLGPYPAKRNIHKCQEEMLEAGVGKFAQL